VAPAQQLVVHGIAEERRCGRVGGVADDDSLALVHH
jgi:hypothetical protein